MCGITGWVAFDRDLTRDREVVEAMTETMSCRGPDAAGVWFDRHAALGHRRLAVIDIPGGAQPMSVSTPNGDVAMVYSGEAYNFTELRDELIAKGETFTTSSDTEVVLRGYLVWGEALADRLNGMYAFAIWDSRVRKLVMIRDRMGIKPFYFSPTRDGVLFGSEPKAILANPLAGRTVDADGLREMFASVKTPRHAVWKGMREVEPGTIVTVDERGVRERTYWRLESKLHTDDQDTTVGRVRDLLDDIVRRQLVADVPECVLLSGGLDSSAITALSARELREPVRTFAVDFVEQAENFKPNELRPTMDTPYVHDVAQHVGSDHTDIVLDHTQLADLDIRRKVVAARDLPMGIGDMDASLYLLFKAIREQSTVALSGESADEIFGGYRQFHDQAVQKTDAFPWLAMVNSPLEGSDLVLAPELRTKLDLDTYLEDRYGEAVAEVERLDAEDEFTHRMRVMSYLHLTRFVRILLDRKDRMSMAVGLEVRVPFCDHRLVEYVYNTPWSLKTYDGREKSLLRGATRDVLPESVVQRVKSPYPSTSDPRYGAALQAHARDILAADNDALFALVDRNVLSQIATLEADRVEAVQRSQLERTLDLSVWLDMYKPDIAI
ncbi:asparagine synthase, glutamine-hydrolyzing [Mycolicibacterium chubuense NBB4]|uniref:asparagine synthase (glutamine-hydrolyzing) n=1 Tax=Mycolicibacterium chubuense (strain NBB4) TaxID=710421 RepID=I4BP57_MYCCN|nr:asparagine synthase (glutamine-hydrolyzing) [Mycolicibacterium chubuense]AFM19064.1 asparagine synthase, glutamine-hydrolyzing [Mycolicibacterium chubuense NBB4]